MSVANVEHFIKKYGKSAREICTQVPEAVHPHLFRHSYVSHLYRMGFPLPMIAKLLDYESLKTTEIHAETDTKMVNAAFREMEDSLQNENPLQSKDNK